jgi:tetratricopeptide (TPR) repeat protein
MKGLALALVVIMGCGSPAPAQAPKSPPATVKHSEMLAIMENFLASPFADPPLKKITEFVEQSHDVTVVVDVVTVPFVEEDLDEDAKGLLLAGFLAGDAASQLRSGVRGDDIVSGVEGALRIYLALKSRAATTLKDRRVVSPSLDALLEMQGNGQLRAHLERARSGGKPVERSAPVAAARRDPEEEKLVKLLEDGESALTAGRSQEAIADYFDKVIASYEQRYTGGKLRVYCAHDMAEVLLYMTEAAQQGGTRAAPPSGTQAVHQADAIALPPTWADAWFLKSYALTELHKDAEAAAALDRALALSPRYARYLNERAFHYAQAKDWRRALQLYGDAEDAAKLITNARGQRVERTRALRGQGYTLVELGDLDGAEAKYRASLALDPDDTKAKQELDYIQGVRKKP